MSKRRRGYPSETHVKRGRRFIKGGEIELSGKLGRPITCIGPAPAVRDAGFKACCMTSGRYDGAERKDYFQGVMPQNLDTQASARARRGRPRRSRHLRPRPGRSRGHGPALLPQMEAEEAEGVRAARPPHRRHPHGERVSAGEPGSWVRESRCRRMDPGHSCLGMGCALPG